MDIDDPILREVKAIHEKEGARWAQSCRSCWRMHLPGGEHDVQRPAFRWTSRPMKALVDLADKDALYAALDADRS